MKIIIILISAFFIIHCNTSKSPVNPTLGKEFELNYGQSKTLNNYVLTIKFKNVIEDSRCPEGAICVWEGNAKVAIEISQNDFLLNTALEPKEIEYDGFKVQLVSVSPYPKINEQIETKDYKIKLIVEK